MNEDKLKAEIEALLPKELLQKKPPEKIQTSETPPEHPLHMLDNQADPEKKPTIVLQKPIRTYESDVADALAHKNTSILTMKIAEDAKKRAEVATVIQESAQQSQQSVQPGMTVGSIPTSSQSSADAEPIRPPNYGRKIFMTVLSLIFVAGGGLGGYYLYLKSPLANEVVKDTEIKIPSIVMPDVQKIISIDGLLEEKLIKGLANTWKSENVDLGKIHEFILTEASGENTVRVTGSNFINKLGLNMPDTLKRSLTDRWMMGVYVTDESRDPFIILTTDFFQNTYAGMLKWEAVMPDELAVVFDYKERAELANGTSSISSFFNIKGKFEDRVILNRDVREFRDEAGNLFLLYSFLNKDTLVISTSEAIIRTLIDKIEKQTYIR